MLYFAQARFYDPSDHRFTQQDPAKDGANWYVYCGNNPVLMCDPTGLVAVSSYGDSGYHIAQLQDFLSEYGYFTSSSRDARSFFGLFTTSALMRFQMFLIGYSWDDLFPISTGGKYIGCNQRTATAIQHVQGQNGGRVPAPEYMYDSTSPKVNARIRQPSNYFYIIRCEVYDNPYGINIKGFLQIARAEAEADVSRSNPRGRSYVWQNAAWCANFVKWVSDQAGVPSAEMGGMHRSTSTGDIMRWYIKQSRFKLSYSTQRDARHVRAGTTDPDPNNRYWRYDNSESNDRRYFDVSVPRFMEMFNDYGGNAGSLTKDHFDALLDQSSQQTYLPKEGDLIITRNNNPGPNNHIGIVEAYSGGIVYTIEGNTSDDGKSPTRVMRKQHDLRDLYVMGFCQNGSNSIGVVP